jgi:hypothetical protein
MLFAMRHRLRAEFCREEDAAHTSSVPLRAATPDSVVATTAVARPADHDFMRTC